MKSTTISVVGTVQGRGTAPDVTLPTQDQIFVNCVPEIAQNPISGQAEVWVNKLQTYEDLYTTSTTTLQQVYVWEANAGAVVSAGVGASTVEINIGATQVASFTKTTFYGVVHISETTLGTQPTLMFQVGNSEGYYLPLNAGVAGTTSTFTGDLTPGSAVVTNIASTTGIYEGQTLSGTGIAAGTRVQSVDSATQITMTANATSAGGAGTTITRSNLAKIINANFPGNAGYTLSSGFVHMDGFAFVQTSDGKVWNSTVNNLATWTAAGYAPTSNYPDTGKELCRVSNYIVAFNTGSYDTFINAGLSPSPLQRVPQLSEKIGSANATAMYPSGSSAKEVDAEIYFIGKSSGESSGDVAVYRMATPGRAERVSTGTVEKFLAQFLSAGSQVLINGAATFNGQKSVLIAGWIYFPNMRLWWLQTVYSGSYLSSGRSGRVFTVSGNTKVSVAKPESPVYTGVTSTMQLAGYELSGGSLTFYDQVEVVAKQRASSGNTTIYTSDDDGGTWDTQGTVDLSVRPCQLRGLGTSQRRAWKIEDAVAQNHQIQAIRIRYEGLAH